MDNYTVTFVYNGDFDLPNDPKECAAKVPGLVLQKMEAREFELADFNYTENYNEEAAANYIADKCLHRSVVEMIVGLDTKALQSRENIYDLCLSQLKQGKLHLGCAFENENQKLGMLQSIIKFANSPQKLVCVPPQNKVRPA